ncbi:MAG: tRNA pseudouridine(55) synthase TruB [Candidatus Gastranaerophilaceae bacterium]
MFGFLNVYKPKGMTSHDVVAKLRRTTKIKQIGHTGILDPFAEGVLPICIGKATRLIEYLADSKAYVASVQFGKTTDTYDLEGTFLTESDKTVSETEIIEALKKFQGEIEQVPPIYSALKVNGKKLYEYARAGQEVEIKPRKVLIEDIKLISFNFESQIAEIYIKCSKGTYIRTIGHDLGQNLGCGAYLTNLKRVQAGDFYIADSVKLDTLDSLEAVNTNLIYPLKKLPLEQVIINEIEFKRIYNGLPIYPRNGISGMVSLVYDNKLVGIAEASLDNIRVKKVIKDEN